MSSVSFGRVCTNSDAYLAIGVGVVIIGWSPILIRLSSAPGVTTAFFPRGHRDGSARCAILAEAS